MKKSIVSLVSGLLVLCALFSAGCGAVSKNTALGMPEVRNNGKAIQWKYDGESEWHDLIELDELRGASGKDGSDGKDGNDGKDGLDGKVGADGKTVEIRRDSGYIQWRYEDGEWQNLVALADITGPSGANGTKGIYGKDGKDGKTPEFRVSKNTLQWRYTGDEIWLNLYDFSLLKGADGKDGKDGANGKDGVNGKDGENGKDGQNGSDGVDGKDGATPALKIGDDNLWYVSYDDGATWNSLGVKATGDKGDTGSAGDPGENGKDGTCTGYFYASECYSDASFGQPLVLWERSNSGGLFDWNLGDRTVTLRKGHTYSITFCGSVSISAKKNGMYSVALDDGFKDNDRYGVNQSRSIRATLIDMCTDDYKNSRVSIPFTFSRICTADEDIVLQYKFCSYDSGNTELNNSDYSLTVIALD